MIAEPEYRTDAGGHLWLILRGDGGVITVEAWESPGIRAAIMEIHSPVHLPGTSAAECPYSGSGWCYREVSFSGGSSAGLPLLGGHPEEAAEVAREWYGLFLAPREKP